MQLTEIAYSLIEDVNHGKVSISGLTAHIARMFNTEIKDCYGAYGDIKKHMAKVEPITSTSSPPA